MCVSLTIVIHILCFVYTVILHVPLWLQVCCTVSGQSYPTMGIPYSIIYRLVATRFSLNYVLMQLLSGIKGFGVYKPLLVSTTCCDVTITKHKHNTNIQDLRYVLLIHSWPYFAPCVANLSRELKHQLSVL